MHVTEEHQHLLAGSAENGLLMNVSKCKSMVIRKANVHSSYIYPTLPEVESVEELRILEVIFNTRFTWTNHVGRLHNQEMLFSRFIQFEALYLPCNSEVFIFL